jgi:heme exporter protein A
VTTFCGSRIACVRSERPIFRDLSFRVEPGGALVLVGPNGAGKSSLLRILAGLLPPEAGSLSWDGIDLLEDPAAHRRLVAFLGHGDAVKPALTVRENLTFWCRFRCAGADADQRVATALDRFGLTRLAALPARFLSAGQKRRLALGRLLLTDAPLWLLDEAKTALDREAAGRVDETIEQHRQLGGILVLSTHGDDRPEGATTLNLADFQATGSCSGR